MKHKRKKIQLLMVFVCLVFLSACEYEYITYDVKPIPDNVSYSSDIQPIFNDGCNMSGCHASGGISPDLTPANSYEDLWAEGMIDTVTPNTSILYTKMAPGGSMAQYSGPGDADLVLAWIEQGALDN